MRNNLVISNNFANFEAWIGGSCKPSDKGKLTAFPRFKNCQRKLNIVSTMLSYEELPEINSPRWLSLEDFEGEEWRDIEGAEGSFMISNYGRVKALERIRKNHYSTKIWPERIRRLSYNAKKYPQINLTINSKKILVRVVHRLVALAFIPNPDNKPHVDHINTNIKDCRVCNLRWTTPMENAHNPITERRVHELNSRVGIHHKSPEVRKLISEKMKGEKNPWFGIKGSGHPRSVAVIQVSLDGEYIKEWENINMAKELYGCHISDCCRGRRTQCGGFKWIYKEDYFKI